MSTRVYGWDQNPDVDRFCFRCSNSSAENALRIGRAFEVIDADGRRAIQLVEPDENAGYISETVLGFALSANNVMRFIKTSQQGDRLHYEIPHAGDRGIFARHHRKFIRVSARSGMRYLRAAAVPPTAPLASRLLAG
ncbi:MAG TPA: hypothetical protein VKP61_00620 [Candidatus Acidoferrum sp.]|nr:hypothetical protein [Candidatus Acidoferrum sp.]